MDTHNAIIYHCVACGAIKHGAIGTKPPQCCGRPMATAAVETIHEGDPPADDAGGAPPKKPPVGKDSKKPR